MEPKEMEPNSPDPTRDPPNLGGNNTTEEAKPDMTQAEADELGLDYEELVEFRELYSQEELLNLKVLFNEADRRKIGFLSAEELFGMLCQIYLEGVDSQPTLEMCQELVKKSNKGAFPPIDTGDEGIHSSKEEIYTIL